MIFFKIILKAIPVKHVEGDELSATHYTKNGILRQLYKTISHFQVPVYKILSLLGVQKYKKKYLKIVTCQNFNRHLQ